MTYFPMDCFALIKSFAGINPAKYFNKKVADLIIRANVTHYSGHDEDVGEWTFLDYEPEIKGCAKRFKFYYSVEDANLPQNYRSTSTHWRGRPKPALGPPFDTPEWLKNMPRQQVQYHLRLRHKYNSVIGEKFPDTYIKQHILLQNATAALLKEYCKENKMKGYSKFKKADLITFILKYEFD